MVMLGFFFTALKAKKLKRKNHVDDIVAIGDAKKIQNSISKKKSKTGPISFGCARCSIGGWQWRRWTLRASPAERARYRGTHIINAAKYVTSGPEAIGFSHLSNVKGLSARTNRVKLRSLLAAADGADLLKATQLKVMKALSYRGGIMGRSGRGLGNETQWVWVKIGLTQYQLRFKK